MARKPQGHACQTGDGNLADIVMTSLQDGSTSIVCVPCFLRIADAMISAMAAPTKADLDKIAEAGPTEALYVDLPPDPPGHLDTDQLAGDALQGEVIAAPDALKKCAHCDEIIPMGHLTLHYPTNGDMTFLHVACKDEYVNGMVVND